MPFFKPEIFPCLSFPDTPSSPCNSPPMPCIPHPLYPFPSLAQLLLCSSSPATFPSWFIHPSLPCTPVPLCPFPLTSHFPPYPNLLYLFPHSSVISPNPNLPKHCPNTPSCLTLPPPLFPPIPGPCASVSLVPVPSNTLSPYLLLPIPLFLVLLFFHLLVPQFLKFSSCPLHLFSHTHSRWLRPSLLLSFFKIWFWIQWIKTFGQNLPKIVKPRKKKILEGRRKPPLPPPKALWGPEPGRAVNKPASLYHTGHQRHARGTPGAPTNPIPPLFHPKLVGDGGRGGGGEGEAFRDQELPAERGDFSVLTPPPRHTINTPNLQVSSAECPPFPPKSRQRRGVWRGCAVGESLQLLD